MKGNPQAILTGALLAAGTAGIQAALTALGCGPAGIIASVTAVLTTAITVLGPKWIELRAHNQLSRDIRWLIKHPQEGINPMKIAALLKDYQDKVIEAHAVIEAAHAEEKGRKSSKSHRSSTEAS
jgi:hypothetical protein